MSTIISRDNTTAIDISCDSSQETVTRHPDEAIIFADFLFLNCDRAHEFLQQTPPRSVIKNEK
ncbi:MAG: hypothetical protein GVY17_13355 [Cyanobacteria bacterium]|jgi:hypothetical protein|nr:hypothetical protein [Cyanobacteria bacterium GSL.Bin21]